MNDIFVNIKISIIFILYNYEVVDINQMNDIYVYIYIKLKKQK